MDITSELTNIFGSFRAENLGDQIFHLYTKPAYFPKLLTQIPCLLQGGRGTGKTTVLKSLSYEGQFRLAGNNFNAFEKLNYIGIYYKLETGLVTAFSGAEKDDFFWQRMFSHFINLQISKELCEYTIWHERNSGVKVNIDSHYLNIFLKLSELQCEPDLHSLLKALELAIAELESNINYASDLSTPKFTPIGSLPRKFLDILKFNSAINNKIIYIVFDEYENLLECQQEVLNTFIKQADSALTFKIGVRELGLKTRKTLNPNEQLVDPADYVLIDVSNQLTDKQYDDFASNVIENRFEELRAQNIEVPSKVSDIFEDLSEEEEAKLLGADNIAIVVKDQIKEKANKEELIQLDKFSDREFALMDFFANSQNESIYAIFKSAIKNTSNWKNKVNNYGYASLFTLRKKKVGISKYYTGWKTLLSLSAGNIRYLLQLVANSLVEHTKSGNSLMNKVSAKLQTEVAREVGQKNVLELEGLSTRGAQLMKMVIGLGQVFHVMAVQPEKHAPEITQFEISTKSMSEEEIIQQVNELLHAAVMHLALIRTSGTKLGGPGDTRDFDYMLHPIFAPFFVYSYRRKRKFSLTPEELLGIVNNPQLTIRLLLAKQNRILDTEIPEQLFLFGKNYEGNN
jgi:hypothetical protein